MSTQKTISTASRGLNLPPFLLIKKREELGLVGPLDGASRIPWMQNKHRNECIVIQVTPEITYSI